MDIWHILYMLLCSILIDELACSYANCMNWCLAITNNESLKVCLVCTCLVCLSICLSASLPVTRVYCDLKRLCDSCGTTAPSQPGDVQAHAGLRPEGPAVRHQRLPGRRREAHHEQAQRHREGRAARRRAGRGRNSHVGERRTPFVTSFGHALYGCRCESSYKATL